MAKSKRKAPSLKRSQEHVALDEEKDDEFQTEMRAKKAKTEKEDKEDKRGVVLLSHIPHGFYECQMYSFFSQFGDVTRLKLIRSKKTGRSRHFAFIEFQYEEVAKVVAETMDNYLMFQKILKCKLLPLDQVKPLTFKNWQTKFRLSKTRNVAIKEHNKKIRDPAKEEKRLDGLKAKREQLQKKLKELGIDYDVTNIKINQSFVAPETPRATPEDVAHAMRDIHSKHRQKRSEGQADQLIEEKGDESNKSESENETEKVDDPEYVEPPSVKEECRDKESSPVASAASDAEDKKAEMKPTPKKKGKRNALAEVEDKNSGGNEGDFGVMVVDLDDSDITFKSPPASAKIRRKSVGNSRKSSKKTSSDEQDSNKSNSGELKVEKLKVKRGTGEDKLAESDDSPQRVKKKRFQKKIPATPGPRIKDTTSEESGRVMTRKRKSKLNKTM